MRRLILFGAALLMLGACTDPNAAKIKELKKEAIAVHDEVMPKMGTIAELRTSLKGEWKSVKDDTTGLGDSLAPILAHHIEMLDSADEAMMSWMADYDPSYAENNPGDSAVSYYSDQGTQIKEVKVLMENAIADAEKLAGSLK